MSNPYDLSSSLIILINIQNNWYSVDPKFAHAIGGLFLAKSLAVEQFSLQENTQNYNIFQLFSYSHRIYKNTFIVKQISNNDKPSIIIHWYKNKLLKHTVDLRQRQHNLNRRCTIKKIQSFLINNEIIKVDNKKASIDNSKKCLCVNFSNNTLQKTKVEPLGIVDCNRNLETNLKTLGLYKSFEKAINFCSKISLFSFDIETTYTRFTAANSTSTGIYSNDNNLCGNIKGILKGEKKETFF